MALISVLTSLYRCENYLDRFFNSVQKINNLHETEFIFIHNDPTEIEREIIFSFIQKIVNITYQYNAVPLEGLYTSWNRGISIAKGELIAIWNVDDIRFPNSLVLQSSILKRYNEIDLVYGNKFTITSLNNCQQKLHKVKDISKSSWYRSFQDGTFLMWRKSVHDNIGYFDEQFKLGGDSEYWYRLTTKCKVVKIEDYLGICLTDPDTGISRTLKCGEYEEIISGLRHGFYPRMVINPFRFCKAFKMINPRQIHYLGQTRKQTILKYHSPLIYIMSFFYLVFLSIPLFILSRIINLNKYNYHYFKRLIL